MDRELIDRHRRLAGRVDQVENREVPPSGNLIINAAGDAIVVNDMRIGGGLYVGDVGVNPPDGVLVVADDVRVGGGISVGSQSLNTLPGSISVPGAVLGTTSTNINDDTAISVTPTHTIGAVLVIGRATGYSDIWGLAAYRIIATNFCIKMVGGTPFATSTSVPTGTTGVDGNFTVSVNSGTGLMYFENRRGLAVSIHYLFFGS